MSLPVSACTVVVQLIFTILFGAAYSEAAGAQATPSAPAPKLKGVWEPVNYTEDLSLTDVFFVTSDIGYASGAAGTILKTTDAGASWTPLLGGDPQSEERSIDKLWFVSPTVGWAAQVTSTTTNLFRTTDGETWTRIGEIEEHYEDFAFSSPNDGVYVDDEDIWRTQDAGKTWRKVFTTLTRAELGGLTRQVKFYLYKVQFATPSVAYALGDAAGDVDALAIFKSADGGTTWSMLSLIEGEKGAEGGLFFIDEKTGYVSTTYAKAAYRTSDGGQTWTGMPATQFARRMLFADPGVGWALHFNKLSYTTDGGKRWFSRELAFPAMPHAFSLPRRDRGYVVGDHGMIYRYSVVPETTTVAARAILSPAMPALDNAVLGQMQLLETRLDKIEAAVQAEGSGGAGTNGDWSSAAVDQQIAQLQATVDTVASGVPAMGSRHRNLNLVTFGLQLLTDLTGQGAGLKQAFASLTQSKDLASASTALQSLNTQLDAMKASVETFKTARKSGS
jgi:photosystem II stability/assembly factor-like uncharacterized protein